MITDSAIPREVINDKTFAIKDKLLNPNKYKANVTRRQATEQRIYENIRQHNSPSLSGYKSNQT